MKYYFVRKAILEKQSLTAVYENYVRRFTPHAIGKSRAGYAAVVVFQYGGGRLGGLPISGEWNIFEIDGLKAICLNGDNWSVGFPETRPLSALALVDVSARLELVPPFNRRSPDAIEGHL